MKDTELQKAVLQFFYEHRRDRERPEPNRFGSGESAEDLLRICDQLSEKGLIDWNRARDSMGRTLAGHARITAAGVENVESQRETARSPASIADGKRIMPAFVRKLKAGTPEPTKAILDYILDKGIAHGKWPPTQSVHRDFGKEEVKKQLRGLDSRYVIERDGSDGHFYELRLLGFICSSRGDLCVMLLWEYLEYLRDRFYQGHDIRTIEHSEIQRVLDLNSENVALLGRVILSGFPFAGGSYQPDFSSWTFTTPPEVDDLPRTGDLEENFEKWIFDSRFLKPVRLVLLDDWQQASSVESVASTDEEEGEYVNEDNLQKPESASVGPWTSGSFYVIAFVVIVGEFFYAATKVGWWVVPIVAITGILSISVIGALQLRHDDRLKDESFLKLMTTTLRQLVLIRQRTRK